ncbi:putative Zn-dependent protease [Sphingomonas jejuensis]|uniref:Zn-dependent protease n=1 Tax=Sphingomonas jejuensis TaxID=904715 RepID=A0ABX0XIV4_9SPHN|nr:M48 family metallopeptidase [Sphingomonas jejuensis]NJC33254.1 putative Zn-dependent protease [Sphingomonas jejuensis]
MKRIAHAAAAVAMLCQPPAVASGQVPVGYQPVDSDERGLWMVMAEEERRVRDSNFVIQDPALNAYVRQVLCRTVGPRCAEVRIYLMRTPYFNASMAPNGMMQVWSGLFLRTRNEAQLAAVLAHEYTHYEEQHSLRIFRDVRDKSTVLSFLSLPLSILGGMAATTAAQFVTLATIFGFSRENERAADRGSVTLLTRAGYDPAAAAAIWEGIEAEREAAAAARGRSVRPEIALFGTHPTSRARMEELRAQAAAAPAGARESGEGPYQAALAGSWAMLVDDQIKLNDYGATELLLTRLAADGWTGSLIYARAELMRARGTADDLRHAEAWYQAAIVRPDAPAEARRGLGLTLLRRGEVAAGRAAIASYLEHRPNASDGAMLRAMTGA